ncbi:MAG: BMP family ABC transporter substrate-binding protein, partial [Ktedonobacterales bacterium]|nr:BMP family ABC transporter substrate-binding protein [Ktedonobacterales bacterium]
TYKVGLVTDTGGLNDRGFNSLAYQGLQKAEQDHSNVKGDVTQSTSDASYVPNLTNYASQRYDLVVAVGFLMQGAVGQVAQQYPNVKFALIDGVPQDANQKDLSLPNVASLLFREQDAGALVGVAAGMIEKQGLDPKKSNTIGAVGGFPIPPVTRYIAGYKWGARHEDPTVKVLVDYGNSFSDSAKCRDKANAMIGSSADILFQVAGGCGLGVLAAADQANVWSIGVDTDQKAQGKNVIASALKRVEVATDDAINKVVAGTFQSGTNTYGLNNDGVGIVAGNLPIPAAIMTEIQSVEAQIKAGTLMPPDQIQP